MLRTALAVLALTACSGGAEPSDTNPSDTEYDTGNCSFEGDTVPVNVRVLDTENNCFGPRIAEQRDADIWTGWAVQETCGACGDSEAAFVDTDGRCLYVNHWCDETAPSADRTLVGGCVGLHDTDLGSEHPCCVALGALDFCE